MNVYIYIIIDSTKLNQQIENSGLPGQQIE